jgi:hypothetical protein
MTDKPAKPDAEKLLPREPSDLMRSAGQWAISDNLTVSVCVENNFKAADIWRAMWDAARPLPTSLQPQEQPEQDQGICQQCGIANRNHHTHLAPFNDDYHEFSPTSITDRDGVERALYAERTVIVQNKRVNDAIQTALEQGELTISSEGWLTDVGDGVEAAFREGFALGDFAGGGQADPRTVELAWQNSRARAALRPTDGAAR